MAKVLRWRLEDAPDAHYLNNKFEVEEQHADIKESHEILNIEEAEAIVLWNDTLEDRYVPVYQGLGNKLLLHSNEYVTITPGSVAEMLYYYAAADDADVYCNTSENFEAQKG